MSLLTSLRVSAELNDRLELIKRLLGPEKWATTMAECRPVIEKIMAATGEPPLAAVLPAAKACAADGRDPSLILAVATQMTIDAPL